MTDDPKRIPDDDRLDDLARAQLALVQQQIKAVTDNALLIKVVESPLGAAFLLGVVRGRLNCMSEVGLLTAAQANKLAEEIKVLYDKRFPSLAEFLEGSKHAH
jgi:hypothetical protein